MVTIRRCSLKRVFTVKIIKYFWDVRVFVGFVVSLLFWNYLFSGPHAGWWGYVWIIILNPFFVVLRISLNPYSFWDLDISPKKVKRSRYEKSQVPPGEYFYYESPSGEKWIHYRTPEILPPEFHPEDRPPPVVLYRKRSAFLLHALTLIESLILIRVSSSYHLLIHCIWQYMPVAYPKKFETEFEEVEEIKKYGAWQIICAYFPLLVEAIILEMLP